MQTRAWVSCLAVVVATTVVLSGCGGGSGGSSGVRPRRAHLHQTAPGTDPVIRVGWVPSGGTDPAKIVAWLVYRDTSFGLAAEPPNLIDARGHENSLDFWDTAAGAPQVTFTRDFTYFRLGEQENGHITVTYTRPALIPGTTYYYRARLVVKPHSTAPPIATTAASTFDLDPPDALTDASVPQGPVTYFFAPVPDKPSNGSTAVDPRRIDFRWFTTAGADEYQVRVYAASSATGTPVLQSPVITPTGAYGLWSYDAGSSVVLSGGRTYYWVVGARSVGEDAPTCGSESGWIRSAVWQFTTVSLPPGT